MDAGSVMRVPDSFTMHEAAAFMEATITAYLNIFHVGNAQKGSSVLVHGGGSGVGRLGCLLMSARRSCPVAEGMQSSGIGTCSQDRGAEKSEC